MRIADIDSAAGGHTEDIRAWIWGGQFLEVTLLVQRDAVEDDGASAVEGVAGHEGLGQEVEAGSVDDDAWPAGGVDEGASGGVAQYVDVSAFGTVHEGLADVAVDDELAGLEYLAELILGVAVDLDFQTVDAAGEIVTDGVISVDPDAGGDRSRGNAGRCS